MFTGMYPHNTGVYSFEGVHSPQSVLIPPSPKAIDQWLQQRHATFSFRPSRSARI